MAKSNHKSTAPTSSIAANTGLPELKERVTAERLGDIAEERRKLAALMSPQDPKTLLSFLKVIFKIDVPLTVEEESIKRVVAFKHHRLYIRRARKFMKEIAKIAASKGYSERTVFATLKRFGSKKRRDRAFNTTNLENALILELGAVAIEGKAGKDTVGVDGTAGKGAFKGKNIFKDLTFVNMIGLSFAEFVAQLTLMEHMLGAMGERGPMVGRHFNQVAKTNIDAVEGKKYAEIIKDLVGSEVELSRDGESPVKNLRTSIENSFMEGKMAAGGREGDLGPFYSALQRSASATYFHVPKSPPARLLTRLIPGLTSNMFKLWRQEGQRTAELLTAYLKKHEILNEKGEYKLQPNAKGNLVPSVLEDDDFLELCKTIGNYENPKTKLTLVGIQSALLNITYKKIHTDMDDLILEDPLFINLLRLLFAIFVMKLYVQDFVLTALGKEAGFIDRVRGDFLAKEFNALVTTERYEDLINEAKEAVDKKISLGIMSVTKKPAPGTAKAAGA